MWGKEKIPPLLVEVKTGTAALNTSIVISQKIRRQSTLKLSNTTFGLYTRDAQP